MRRFLAGVALVSMLGCTNVQRSGPFTWRTAPITRQEGLDYLARLAVTHGSEGIFAYVPAQGYWHNLSINIGNDRAGLLDGVFMELCKNYDAIELYHYHIYQGGILDETQRRKHKNIDTINVQEFDWIIHGYPSASDRDPAAGNDILVSIVQGYAECSRKQLSFGVVSLEKPWKNRRRPPTYKVIRWTHDTGRFSWPMDENGVSTETFEGIFQNALTEAIKSEEIIVNGVLVGTPRSEILKELSEKTQLRFWEEP